MNRIIYKHLRPTGTEESHIIMLQFDTEEFESLSDRIRSGDYTERQKKVNVNIGGRARRQRAP